MLQVGLDLAFYGASHDLEPSKTVSIYSKFVQAYRLHYSYLSPVYTRASSYFQRDPLLTLRIDAVGESWDPR